MMALGHHGLTEPPSQMKNKRWRKIGVLDLRPQSVVESAWDSQLISIADQLGAAWKKVRSGSVF